MPIIDMHCDTISTLSRNRQYNNPCSLRQNNFHVDLEKLKSADYMIQNFAIFMDVNASSSPFQEALDMIDLYYEELEQNKAYIAPIFCFQDIEANQKQKKLSSMLTLEDGGMLEGKLSNLRTIYRLGARMLTLTWNFENELGYPNIDMKADPNKNLYIPVTNHGLKETGLEFLAEMERLGMIVDVSHLSDAGFYDVLEHTKKPFVASHSNARTICPLVRNLTDHMIHCLGERGGVTGLNFCTDFLIDRMLLPDKSSDNQGIIQAVVKHAKHIVSMGGVECLALGTDFDGIPTNKELPDASYLPLLADALKSEGFTSLDIDKIFYENVLRVYRETL